MRFEDPYELVMNICQMNDAGEIRGVRHTEDEGWLLVHKDLFENLLLIQQTAAMIDTAYGKYIIERFFNSQVKSSIKGCDIPVSVIILTIKGYKKEETARILGVSLKEVEDVLSITEDFDEDVRANLILENSKNLFREDVNDFLLCGGSYTKFRELLDKRAESITGF